MQNVICNIVYKLRKAHIFIQLIADCTLALKTGIIHDEGVRLCRLYLYIQYNICVCIELHTYRQNVQGHIYYTGANYTKKLGRLEYRFVYLLLSPSSYGSVFFLLHGMKMEFAKFFIVCLTVTDGKLLPLTFMYVQMLYGWQRVVNCIDVYAWRSRTALCLCCILHCE